MKKNLLSLFAALAFAASAAAVEYIDNNPANVWLNGLNQSYTGTFDLTDDGFDPSSEIITSAYAEFHFFDVIGNESFAVTVDETAFLNQGSFFWWLSLGDSLGASLLLDLNADGQISYTINRISGEFWLKNARLTGQAEARQVPDGGASVLLTGSALVGLGLYRRRRAA